jgi:formylglycine-generating enzyme required for sulfatase activity
MRLVPKLPMMSALAILVIACGSSKTTLRAPADAVPAKVSIQGGTVTTGTFVGTLRRDVTLAPYAITKTPITVRQYKECVSAGACSRPSVTAPVCQRSYANDGDTFSMSSGTEDRPVTCVTSADATAYCGWVGGRLPTASEWTLAARGPAVQRYAWGATDPTCTHRSSLGPVWQDCCGTDCQSDVAVTVGKHPAGDSPFGVSDVLLARGELTAADPTASYPGCQHLGNACIATGMVPGAIDAFAPEPLKPSTNPIAPVVTSFRCAWDGGAQ